MLKKPKPVTPQLRWKLKNPEKVKEIQRRFRLRNLEKIREADRQHYWNNREKILEKNRQIHLENPEKVREYQHQWRLKNLEKIRKKERQNYHVNREKILEEIHQYRTKIRKAFLNKLSLFPKDECWFCDEPITKFTGQDSDSFCTHHIDFNHDNNAQSNVTYAHHGCHSSYHSSILYRVK